MSHSPNAPSRARVLAHVVTEWRSPAEVRMAMGGGDQHDIARVLEDLADGSMIERQRVPIPGLRYDLLKYRSMRR